MRISSSENTVLRQLMVVLVLTLGIIAVLLLLPASIVSDTTRGQLFNLIGIVIAATISLASTTFVGNAFAGLLLRLMGTFRIGDFVSVGDYFGRVTEHALFKTEIQTEDSDLVTLPNLYLVNNPVKVIQAESTIVAAEVSLGYDVHWKDVDVALVEAVTNAGLEFPFVQVLSLGDFSIVYRAAGRLKEVKQILAVRSRLRECMLDSLHSAGIEIVSPGFMNQRNVTERPPFMAVREKIRHRGPVSEPDFNEVVFGKAERAEDEEEVRLAVERAEALRVEAEAAAAAAEELKEKATKAVVSSDPDGPTEKTAELVAKAETQLETAAELEKEAAKAASELETLRKETGIEDNAEEDQATS